MLADHLAPSPQLTEGGRDTARRRARPRRRGAPARRTSAAAAFVGSFGLLVAYALPGGAYSETVRQEYAILVWALLGLGLACGVLPRARPSRPVLVALGLLVLYGAWIALSLTWTESPERTTAELARVVGYIGVLALLGVALHRGTWRAALFGLGTAATGICLLALIARLAPSLLRSSSIVTGGQTNRLTYPFGYWNAIGAWAAMSSTLALAWSAHESHRLRRAATLAALPITAATLYLSYSRASFAGVAVGAMLVMVLSRNRITVLVHAVAAGLAGAAVVAVIRGAPEIARGTGAHGAGAVAGALVLACLILGGLAAGTGMAGLDRRRPPVWLRAGLALVLAAGIAFSAAAFGPRLAHRAWDQFRQPVVVTTADPASRLTQLSGNRYALWRSALNAFDAHPFSGTGAGTFEFWWDRTGSNAEFVRNAHSLELENLAELGLPGLLLIVGVMAAALVAIIRVRRRARRRLSAGAAAGALAAFIVYLLQASADWMWQSTAVTVLALGLCAAVAARRAHAEWRPRGIIRGLIALAAVGAIAIEVPGLLAASAVSRSQSAVRAGQGAQALAWANAAVGAESWSASAYDQRAVVREASGQLQAAVGDLHHAISLEPDNFRPWVLLARVQAERGDAPAALAAYTRARSLRPLSLLFSGS